MKSSFEKKEFEFVNRFANCFQESYELPQVKLCEIFTNKNVKIYKLCRRLTAWEDKFNQPGETEIQRQLKSAISSYMEKHADSFDVFYQNQLEMYWVTNRFRFDDRICCFGVVFSKILFVRPINPSKLN